MLRRFLLVSACAAALVTGSSVNAAPVINVVCNVTNTFLQANQLQSSVISVTGFAAGTAIRGIKGTAVNPWGVKSLMVGGVFFNIDTVIDPFTSKPLFIDGVYAAPSDNPSLNGQSIAARFDSGLLGSLTAQPNSANLGFPTDQDPDDDVGGFALFHDAASDLSIAPMEWMSTAPGGIPVNASSTFRVMRLTWNKYVHAQVSFVLVMTDGTEIPLTTGWMCNIEPYGACCLPNGQCLAWVPNFICVEQGGVFHAEQPCQPTCSWPLGACCVNATSCYITTQPECAYAGWTWRGAGTTCGASLCQTPPTPCPADITPAGGDRVVNIADLLVVINSWGACSDPNNCPSDIAPPGPPTGDDVVNVADLLAVIDAWGACPP